MTAAPTRTGFYYAKIHSYMPWTIIYVYIQRGWSGVWRADPDSGSIDDIAEWGERIPVPDERDGHAVNPPDEAK